MTLNNVTVGKELRRGSQMNASCDEDDRWHLGLVRFEPVVSFPFSLLLFSYNTSKPSKEVL